MPRRSCRIDLPDPDATAALGRRLAPRLGPGDVLLLEGGLGAGKTHFARALIQARLARPEDVPSPTFTLVQVYDAAGGTEIWHSDLYRLSGPDEAVELGLDEAFETAICLVEWPDRLADLAPEAALTLRFESTRDGAARQVAASWSDARWDGLLEPAS
ncbi:tRNA (adenosine(37)-N6)-threonylcarbamoyltransferase complex ATPase subunit type 1 TsaE [Roseivivax sp. CAU 1761]